jgi:hypothetical protein
MKVMALLAVVRCGQCGQVNLFPILKGLARAYCTVKGDGKRFWTRTNQYKHKYKDRI